MQTTLKSTGRPPAENLPAITAAAYYICLEILWPRGIKEESHHFFLVNLIAHQLRQSARPYQVYLEFIEKIRFAKQALDPAQGSRNCPLSPIDWFREKSGEGFITLETAFLKARQSNPGPQPDITRSLCHAIVELVEDGGQKFAFWQQWFSQRNQHWQLGILERIYRQLHHPENLSA